MLSKCAGSLCALAALAFLLAGGLAVQTTFATITGTVADSSGAVIPGAAVTAVNVATNIETVTEANAAGIYTLAQLKEGEYVVKARRRIQGLRRQERHSRRRATCAASTQPWKLAR